ncbi:hypothetical protein HDU76_002956 [Blyttiomyces sp. JEL0837]|nr:hypothetical protein HDU76_002956 [Blyttiomyces sp. JEL0837]
MQFKFITLPILLGASIASALPQSTPSNHTVDVSGLPSTCFNPVPKTCNFYFDCVEKLYPCGPDGYAQGYGGHYCNAFAAKSPQLSAKANQWMWGVMSCLQHALVPKLGEPLTCQAIHDYAFPTHVHCYLDSGVSICDLSPIDWIEIVSVIGIPTLLQLDSGW